MVISLYEIIDTEHTAGVLIQYKDEYLLCQRASGKWSIPKGHLKKGEGSVDAAIRELKEETGIDVWPGYLSQVAKTTNEEGGNFKIYKYEVSKKLTPTLNEEHVDYGYFTKNNLPEPLDKSLNFL